jgi:hypothetical protein
MLRPSNLFKSPSIPPVGLQNYIANQNALPKSLPTSSSKTTVQTPTSNVVPKEKNKIYSKELEIKEKELENYLLNHFFIL